MVCIINKTLFCALLASSFLAAQRMLASTAGGEEEDLLFAIGNFSLFVADYTSVADEVSKIAGSYGRLATAKLLSSAQAMCSHVTLAKEAAERMCKFHENGTLLSLDEESAIRRVHANLTHEAVSLGVSVAAGKERVRQLTVSQSTDDEMTKYWRSKVSEYTTTKVQLCATAQSTCGAEDTRYYDCNCHEDCSFFVWFCDDHCSTCSESGVCRLNRYAKHADRWSACWNYEKLLADAETKLISSAETHRENIAAALGSASAVVTRLEVTASNLTKRVQQGGRILDGILAARRQSTEAQREIEEARLILGRASSADCGVSDLVGRLANSGASRRLLLRVLQSPMDDVRQSLRLAYSSKSFLASLLSDQLAEPYRRSLGRVTDRYNEFGRQSAMGTVWRKSVDSPEALTLDQLDKLVEEIKPHGSDCRWDGQRVRDGKVVINANTSFWFMCENGTLANGGCVGERQTDYLVEVGSTFKLAGLEYRCAMNEHELVRYPNQCLTTETWHAATNATSQLRNDTNATEVVNVGESWIVGARPLQYVMACNETQQGAVVVALGCRYTPALGAEQSSLTLAPNCFATIANVTVVCHFNVDAGGVLAEIPSDGSDLRAEILSGLRSCDNSTNI